MKRLLDEILSRRLVPLPQAIFPGSSQVSGLGLESISDRKLREYAGRDGFVHVTQDADFRDHGAVLGAPPVVIWLRLGNVRKEAVLATLQANSAAITTAIGQSATLIEVLAQ
jgi:predicted nuclease of predicted toxin-antitoxin system